jgi:hypothetical protein
MVKVLAALRTVFLVFIVVYTVLRGTFFQATPEECPGALRSFQQAVWIAIAWIAFDTLVGWLMTLRAPRPEKPGTGKLPPAEPPFAPPRG